jgi:hypothetical protein
MAAFCFTCNASPFFEIARVLVRFDHIVSPSPALAPAGTVAEFINPPMRSGLQSHLFCAVVAFLAACQSPPVNQGTQPNKSGSTAAQPTTPYSVEVDSFDPPLWREPGIDLRGSSYFGRGP